MRKETMSNYGESAIIKNPQLGDVWQNDDLILYIDRISKDKNGKDIIYAYDMDKKGYIAGCWYHLDIFMSNAKYIGKSKTKLSYLFEVKND